MILDEQEWLSQLVSQKDFKAAVTAVQVQTGVAATFSTTPAHKTGTASGPSLQPAGGSQKAGGAFTLESLLKPSVDGKKTDGLRDVSSDGSSTKPKVVKKMAATGDKDVRGFFEGLLKK